MPTLTDKLKSSNNKKLIDKIKVRLKEIKEYHKKEQEKPLGGGGVKKITKIYIPGQGYVPFPGPKYGSRLLS